MVDLWEDDSYESFNELSNETLNNVLHKSLHESFEFSLINCSYVVVTSSCDASKVLYVGLNF